MQIIGIGVGGGWDSPLGETIDSDMVSDFTASFGRGYFTETS